MESTFFNPMQIFNKQRDLLKNAEAASETTTESVFLRPKRDSKYELKLLWLPSSTRKMPWVEQNTHDFWYSKTDDNGDEHRRLKQVICPTSSYDLDRKGYDACPVCARLKQAWDNKDKSPAEKSVYETFKRKFTGYIPVYVVNSSIPDLVGKVKILCYGRQMKGFFSDNIFGDGGEENLGLDAFVYYDPESEELHSSSYNLLVTVNSKTINLNGKETSVGDYSLKFARKITSDGPDDGEWNVDHFLNLDGELNFTKNVMVKSDPTKLMNFKLEYIDGIDPTEAEEEEEDAFAEATIADLTSKVQPKAQSKKVVEEEVEEEEPFTEPAPKKVTPPPAKPQKKSDDLDFDEMFDDEPQKKTPSTKPAPKKASDDDFDLDAMLAELDK